MCVQTHTGRGVDTHAHTQKISKRKSETWKRNVYSLENKGFLNNKKNHLIRVIKRRSTLNTEKHESGSLFKTSYHFSSCKQHWDKKGKG